MAVVVDGVWTKLPLELEQGRWPPHGREPYGAQLRD